MTSVSKQHRRVTPKWVEEPWTEIKGEFNEAIYFKIKQTGTIGKVGIQLSRGDRIKNITIHALDPSSAMRQITERATEWDSKLSNTE